jgi:WD40 repeat protein
VIAAVVIALAQALGDPGFDVSALAISKPAEICVVDLNELKGELRQMSWSPDGRHLHLQTVEDRTIPHDFIVSIDDRELSVAFGAPEWASSYWARKSSLAAPGLPALKMEITETNRRTRPTPFTGGFANGGAQTPDVKNPVDAYEAEVTLRLVGIEIGNWINGAPMAGETFGWGPSGSGALAFVDRPGRLFLIDQRKRRQPIAGVKGASLPAWSDDGSRIAFVQKAGRRRFTLMIVDVGRQR